MQVTWVSTCTFWHSLIQWVCSYLLTPLQLWFFMLRFGSWLLQSNLLGGDKLDSSNTKEFHTWQIFHLRWVRRCLGKCKAFLMCRMLQSSPFLKLIWHSICIWRIYIGVYWLSCILWSHFRPRLETGIYYCRWSVLFTRSGNWIEKGNVKILYLYAP